MEPIMKIEDELDTLIRARYSLLWIESHEEGRVQYMLRNIALDQHKTLYLWTLTKGLMEIEFNPEDQDMDVVKITQDTEDPIKALVKVEQMKKSQGSNGNIVVLKDFHNVLFRDVNSGATDPLVNRKLRDLGFSLKASVTTVVIVSPTAIIPSELQKYINVVSMPLPGKDELNLVLENILTSSEETAPDKVKKEIKRLRKELNNGFRDKILEAAKGLTLEEAENVLSKSLVAKNTLDINIIIAEKKQIVKKSGILEFFESLADMQDIGGLDNLKEWLLERKQSFTKEARDFGIKKPKGVFLTGLPGTGKSLSAKATAKLFEMPLLRFDVSKIFSSLVGSSEQNMTLALKTASAVSPAILWIDEVEKALAGVQSSGQLDSGVTARIFGQLLTWMQEHNNDEEPIFMVVTCNDPQGMKPEFIRRFDETFFVDLPTPKEREEILKIHLTKIKRDPEKFNLCSAAIDTDGYSGSEIENVVQDALHIAFKEKEEINDDHLHRAAKNRKPLSEKRQLEIENLRKWGSENGNPASKQSANQAQSKRQLDYKDA